MASQSGSRSTGGSTRHCFSPALHLLLCKATLRLDVLQMLIKGLRMHRQVVQMHLDKGKIAWDAVHWTHELGWRIPQSRRGVDSVGIRC